ncbi:MAG: DNA replication and repair protein RecF [Chitinophagaceae bacterium]|nr:MAG: DNA replication and repair protein RecF [Chitinophagaceae bacterium]
MCFLSEWSLHGFSKFVRKYKNFRSFHRRLNTIKKIRLVQFRNYSSASFDFAAPITCITGPNGSGKTNLLDAVYYLCYTKSYFTAWQQHTVKSGTDGFRVEGVFQKAAGTEETIGCKWRAGKKEVTADGVEYEKLSDHFGKYAAVMIAPDDMELINDGSEVRRKWMDGILGQCDKTYLESLMNYSRILLQRNAWLKLHAVNPPFDSAELDYYNSQLHFHGTYLYERRVIFLEQFTPLLQNFYRQLSSAKEAIDIRYDSDLHAKPLDTWLRESLQQDLRVQRTLRGPHKDDLQFTFDVANLKQFGSQGQKKSYLFALKLAQYAYLSIVLGHLPILLLDDIFEKLDQSRMEALLRIIRSAGFGQVILTDTHAGRVKEAFGEGVEVGFIAL